MSKYIRLSEANCRNCLRCVRVCPTKAMTYINHQPTIQEDECILCGRCYTVCPHDAKRVHSDLEMVLGWIKNNEKVVLSVAPSFVTVWPRFSVLESILKKRGFLFVEETAKGAVLVSQQYGRLLEEGKMKNIISTCCPAIVSLVEKEFGDLVKYLAPVVSPMIAHGKKLKEQFPDAKVVFLTPCIAKQKEIEDPRFKGIVDATVSMEELSNWLEISVNEEEVNDWEDFKGSIARLYPTPGGIIKTLPRETHYKKVNVEGIRRAKLVFKAMQEDKIEGYFFEISACEESCITGPLLSHFTHNEWLGQSVIRDSVDDNKKIEPASYDEALDAKWASENIYRPVHTEEEIQDMLYMMGKTSKTKEHNCGACGYETCRDKAIAVLEGKADPKVCLPNALEHAESVSNVIIQNTPNGIIVVDKTTKIKEMNPAAKYMLHLDMVNPVGMPIDAILNDKELNEMILRAHGGNETQYYRAYYEEYGKTFDHAIMKLKDEDYIVIILMDLTVEETKEKIMKQMRSQTIEVTQQVIDEQMRTVQEIASLLGETTAKSKVALTKLKKTMEEND